MFDGSRYSKTGIVLLLIRKTQNIMKPIEYFHQTGKKLEWVLARLWKKFWDAPHCAQQHCPNGALQPWG